MTTISSWLKDKLIEQSNGIIFDSQNTSIFDLIQDFIESCDRRFQTPAIYYQAFPEESSVEFLNTLREELTSKLSNQELSLIDIIKDAGLKLIVLDHCHLHPQDTLENLLDFFASSNVAVILIGSPEKMMISQILTNPQVMAWDTWEVDEPSKVISKLPQI